MLIRNNVLNLRYVSSEWFMAEWKNWSVSNFLQSTKDNQHQIPRCRISMSRKNTDWLVHHHIERVKLSRWPELFIKDSNPTEIFWQCQHLVKEPQKRLWKKNNFDLLFPFLFWLSRRTRKWFFLNLRSSKPNFFCLPCFVFCLSLSYSIPDG